MLFFLFLQKTGFDISCKWFLLEEYVHVCHVEIAGCTMHYIHVSANNETDLISLKVPSRSYFCHCIDIFQLIVLVFHREKYCLNQNISTCFFFCFFCFFVSYFSVKLAYANCAEVLVF